MVGGKPPKRIKPKKPKLPLHRGSARPEFVFCVLILFSAPLKPTRNTPDSPCPWRIELPGLRDRPWTGFGRKANLGRTSWPALSDGRTGESVFGSFLMVLLDVGSFWLFSYYFGCFSMVFARFRPVRGTGERASQPPPEHKSAYPSRRRGPGHGGRGSGRIASRCLGFFVAPRFTMCMVSGPTRYLASLGSGRPGGDRETTPRDRRLFASPPHLLKWFRGPGPPRGPPRGLGGLRGGPGPRNHYKR